MKTVKVFILMCALFVVFLPSCGNQEMPELPQTGMASSMSGTGISESEALGIAAKVVGDKLTRAGVNGLPKVEYILSNPTRSRLVSDTIAYVVNYPQDSGFAIIAADNSVYPVLAYSDNNNFSFENELSKKYFTDHIEAYIEGSAERAASVVSANGYVVNPVVDPQIVTQVHQQAPFNKYVVVEHPNCPAGCMPVAAALVLLHTQDDLRGYHDMSYVSCRMIRNAMKNIYFPSSQEGLSSTQATNAYTYSEAVDYIAKLLYWLGKDGSLIYGPNGSGAPRGALASMLFKASQNEVTSMTNFNSSDVQSYLKNKYLVAVTGTDYINGLGGHAWVIDGLEYHLYIGSAVSPARNVAYFHCDWGWGGISNGYYSGEVFATEKGEYAPEYMVAVKSSITI